MRRKKITKTELKNLITEKLATESPADVLELVRVSYKNEYMTPDTLVKVFLAYLDAKGKWKDKAAGLSETITIKELRRYNKHFESTNGCGWAASDRALGNKFYVARTHENGKVATVTLMGNTQKIGG